MRRDGDVRGDVLQYRGARRNRLRLLIDVTNNDHDSLVRRQFGASAVNYRTSATHARGKSLSRLMELLSLEPSWVVLDVATGAGHSAALLAPHVQTVIASDMTHEMLTQAGIVSGERSLPNLFLVRENAQALSYPEDAFNLVVCRIAAHHFPRPNTFVAESARVLKPNGILVVIDNIVPDDEVGADWINSFEKQRDPSHVQCLTLSQWHDLYANNRLTLAHSEVSSKWFDYHDWMLRMNVESEYMERLAWNLLDAPESVQHFWRPTRDDGHISLTLREAILIGRLSG
ncbi:MAG: putative methyltransferase YcgJ [Gammaproteobacteria bacterium]|nr:putative methyltransferase YcgJ [Gammaproteobacteria bacterium]